MIFYHGSFLEVQHPKISFSKKNLDFGTGFYLTTLQSQAERWARRKSFLKKTEQPAIVSIYEINFSDDMYILHFNGYTEKWLEYVLHCRSGQQISENYDAILGPVADDDVFKSINMYFKGIWDTERTLKELRFYEETNQLCLRNKKILDESLIFINSYEVER